MTACTNHGGKARRVVTAALVGVLSVGTVPMAALATGVSDGIETLAVEWNTGAKVSKATDGKGGNVEDPSSVSFSSTSGKYLVPTEVTNQAGDKTTLAAGDFEVAYELPSGTLTNTWDYKYVDADGETQTFRANGTNDVLPADAADDYFRGELTQLDGTKVKVAEGSYTLKITNLEDGSFMTATFTVADEDSIAGAYATFNGSKELVYNGSEHKSGIVFHYANGKTIQVYGAGGAVVDLKGDNSTYVTWTRADGTSTSTLDLTNAGDYVATISVNGETVNVPVTVKQLDLTAMGLSVADQVDPDAINSEADFFSALNASGAGYDTGDFTVTKVVAPDGTPSWGQDGGYSVTIKAADGQSNVTGETVVTFANVNQSAFSFLDVYYNGSVVSGSLIVEPSTFDASLIKVRDAQGLTKLDADQIEITYYEADASGSKGAKVDAEALKESGNYVMSVRVKPYKSGSVWYGGTEDINVTVKGEVAYGSKLSFYLDGELAGTAGSVDFDGSDQASRVTAKVLSPDDKEFVAGTDYTFSITKDGEEVDEIVDAGEYKIAVKPLTFSWASGVNASDYTFTLTVNPYEITALENYLYVPLADRAVAYTGSAVDVPDAQYVADKELKTVPSDLYTVVSVKQDGGKAVDEVVEPGVYTVTIALTDKAAGNYVLTDSNFKFEVKHYEPFADVESPAWYAQVLDAAKNNGYVNGKSGTKLFMPEANITRADAVCVLYNMAGGKKVENMTWKEKEAWTSKVSFTDVDVNEYYGVAIGWADSLGIANGFNGEFRPTDTITREEFAALLSNYAKATGDYEAVDADAVLGSATDYSAWAKDVVAWAKANGVMGNGGYIDGTGNITRAEVAAMAVNYQPEKL